MPAVRTIRIYPWMASPASPAHSGRDACFRGASWGRRTTSSLRQPCWKCRVGAPWPRQASPGPKTVSSCWWIGSLPRCWHWVRVPGPPSSPHSPPTSLDALRAYLDGVAAYRRGAFQVATPALERAVQLDSTFALALSALIEADGWHVATVEMPRVNRLAWQNRNRLNPQDQLFLALRQGSRYPLQTPWTDRIADAERAVQSIPESAEAWYYLGDALYHAGRVSDIAEPEQRARQAFEKAFALDSLYAGPISHMSRVAFIAGDTAAQRLWTLRALALDSTGDGIPLARWDLMRATGDTAGLNRAVSQFASRPLGPWVQAILFQNPLDSVTIAHQPELL